ncbi:MAG: hypothetical protein Q8Q46_01145 [Candidatus Giovannonibacteria bacterium]|nr:hypothetical protein [Candidatus Giovannonibacteria bacterium]
MNTITTPRTIKKGEEFVIIPRKEYEGLLRPQKTNGKDIVVKHSFKVPKRHEKFYNELDKELTRSLKSYKAGNFYGPFATAEALKKSLER